MTSFLSYLLLSMMAVFLYSYIRVDLLMKESSQKYKWNNEVLDYETEITIEALSDGNITSIIIYASTVVYIVWHCVKHCHMTHDRMAMTFVLRHYCFLYIVQLSSKGAHIFGSIVVLEWFRRFYEKKSQQWKDRLNVYMLFYKFALWCWFPWEV